MNYQSQMEARKDDTLTPWHFACLGAAITANNMKTVAMQYFNTDHETIDKFKQKSGNDTEDIPVIK